MKVIEYVLLVEEGFEHMELILVGIPTHFVDSGVSLEEQVMNRYLMRDASGKINAADPGVSILLDRRVSRMGGEEILHHIQSNDQLGSIPIFRITDRQLKTMPAKPVQSETNRPTPHAFWIPRNGESGNAGIPMQ